MTTDNFCFYLQNRLIKTGQTGGQWYIDTSPLVFPGILFESKTLAYMSRAYYGSRRHYIKSLTFTNTLAY